MMICMRILKGVITMYNIEKSSRKIVIRASSLRKLFAKYGVKKANYNGWYSLNFKEVEFSFKDVYIGFVNQAFLCKCDENGKFLARKLKRKVDKIYL